MSAEQTGSGVGRPRPAQATTAELAGEEDRPMPASSQEVPSQGASPQAASPQALRDQAAAMRRAADRVTLMRLRLANSIAETASSQDAATRDLGEDLRHRWNDQEYVELGRIARSLRTGAKELEAAATGLERTTGRRMGGYQGAGFLGRGQQAQQHVASVAHFVGSQQGASIGGYPLAPGHAGSPAPSLGDTLGIPTPDYDEDAEPAEGSGGD